MLVLIDLFSGIGGFSLAAEREGIETLLFCEIDKYCQKVLAKNFPEVLINGDIKTLTKEIILKEIERRYGKYNGTIEFILTGGFPCQPFSIAGKRKGSEDDRALFPQMLRVIRETRPKWIVAENVGGILSIHDGEYFEELCTQLEGEGYSVQSFIIPASAVNAPHKRNRVWIIAYAKNSFNGGNGRGDNGDTTGSERTLQIEESNKPFWQNDVKNAEQFRCGGKERKEEPKERKEEPKERGFGKFSARDDARFSDKDVANSEGGKTGSSDNFCSGEPDTCESNRGIFITNAKSRENDGRKRGTLDEETEGRESINAAVKFSDKDASHTASKGLQGCGHESGHEKIFDEVGTEYNDSIDSNHNKRYGNNGRFCASEIPQFEETEIQGCTSTNSHNPTPARQRGNGGKILSISEPKGFNSDWEESWYEVATRFCRVDDGVSHRVDRLKGLGNAIVPKIAQIIYKVIKSIEENYKC